VRVAEKWRRGRRIVEHRRDPGLVDRALARREPRDQPLVDVDPDHALAAARDHDRRRQADEAQADHGDVALGVADVAGHSP
jgi:hypothetical protein